MGWKALYFNILYVKMMYVLIVSSLSPKSVKKINRKVFLFSTFSL